MSNPRWFFNNNEVEARAHKEFDFLCALRPGDGFFISYGFLAPHTGKMQHEYMLMKRTRCRIWLPTTEKYCYTDETPKLNTLCLFYQNFFGLDSNKTFSSLEDTELNLLTNIYFGKDAKELPLLI